MHFTEDVIRGMVIEAIAAGREDGCQLDLTSVSPLGYDGAEMTSLELLRILVELEDRLDIEFDDGAVMNTSFDVVEDIVSLVVGTLPCTTEPVHE